MKFKVEALTWKRNILKNKMFHLALYFDEKANQKFSFLNKKVEKKFIEHANQLFEKESSQELYFVSLGCFQKSTLYLLPVYNEFLNQLILKIYQTFDEYVSISQKNRYLPYHFVPHVSISRKLNEQQTNQAFKILNHYFEPFYGKVIQVALVKTNPYQEIKIWNL